ncbi:putative hydrolase C9G1.08c [Fusarium oxysporum f. sp. albedinis]|nr:putative hydrolase C9G1.08c [Fusarium oxysporum f. sp. albedinis]
MMMPLQTPSSSSEAQLIPELIVTAMLIIERDVDIKRFFLPMPAQQRRNIGFYQMAPVINSLVLTLPCQSPFAQTSPHPTTWSI